MSILMIILAAVQLIFFALFLHAVFTKDYDYTPRFLFLSIVIVIALIEVLTVI